MRCINSYYIKWCITLCVVVLLFFLASNENLVIFYLMNLSYPCVTDVENYLFGYKVLSSERYRMSLFNY